MTHIGECTTNITHDQTKQLTAHSDLTLIPAISTKYVNEMESFRVEKTFHHLLLVY